MFYMSPFNTAHGVRERSTITSPLRGWGGLLVPVTNGDMGVGGGGVRVSVT